MRALVIGNTGGIGAALEQALKTRPDMDEVVGLSRSADGLDLTRPDSIAACFERLVGPFDMILVATGALHGADQPPERRLRDLTCEALMAQYAINAVGPALILRHALALMPRQQRAVFAALSARVGSIGDNRLGGWYSYRSAKAALNQLVHTAAIEIARTHRQSIVVTLHPGTVATRFTKAYQDHHDTVSPQTAAQNLLAVVDSLTPENTGQFFDWSGTRVPW